MTIMNTDCAAATPLFEGLRGLVAACGPKPDKHHLAMVLISACIDQGLDTRPRIVGALRKLGLNYRHVALVLNGETGDDPRRHWWRRDQEGRYSLHDEGQAGSPAAGSSSD